MYVIYEVEFSDKNAVNADFIQVAKETAKVSIQLKKYQFF